MGGGIIEEIKIFQIGAVTSYISTFIAQVVEKAHFNDDVNIDIGESNYLSSAIAGAFAANIIVKTSLFQGVLASVALNKTIFAVIHAKMHCEEVNTENMLRDFIFDSIFIFYIVWIIKIIITTFFVDEDSEDTINTEQSNIITDVIISVSINIYYVYKQYILENLLSKQ